MRKKFVQFVALILAFAILPATYAAAFPLLGESVISYDSSTAQTISVGLYYGTDTLPAANLQNSAGTGFQIGYLSNGTFVSVGYTQETAISVLKTQNLYYSNSLSDGRPGYTDQTVSDVAVGCFHLELNQVFVSYQEAQMVAATMAGGFPAWIEGSWRVRVGAFVNRDEAVMALNAYPNCTLVGTSSYGFTIVKTGSNQPLFQFDGNTSITQMVIQPGLDTSTKAITWFKGYKYYGSFRYERSDGNNISVINLVDLNDYVDCVISAEMNDSWPLEALKAQAVAVRSYALTRTGHKTFDVCYSEHCQAYHGMSTTGANTARAAAETSGLCARYNGEIIQAVYHSSDGGATENCENVWTQALPYLRGVEDPYEALVADKISNYNWTISYTGYELQQRLMNNGHTCGVIVNVQISKMTPTGNVYSVALTDSYGQVINLTKDSIRTVLGLRSLRFSTGDTGPGYTLADGEKILSLSQAWVLDGNGNLTQSGVGAMYAMTGSGVVAIESGSTNTSNDGTFVFTGSGRGHNLGMSQWGANAMATAGYTYDQILKFYYTGIEIY